MVKPEHNIKDAWAVKKWRETISKKVNELASSGSGLSEEEVQDLISSLLVAGSNITLTYDDGLNTLTIASSSLSDGDKGDIIVSSSGTVFTIDTGVITKSKLASETDAYIIAMAVAL